MVIAELIEGNLHHADTTIINVTADHDAPRMPTHLSFTSLDSTTWAVGGTGVRTGTLLDILGFLKPLVVQATDSAGTSIPGLAIACSASDPTVASVECSQISGLRPGRVLLYATATAYGVTLVDTLPFTITNPLRGDVTIAMRSTGLGGAPHPVFEPSEITIAPGGAVVWANSTGQPVDVTFDDPTNVTERATVRCILGTADPGGTGDIPAFGDTTTAKVGNVPVPSAANCRSRRFPAPGVYPYYSPLTGATGRIIVATGVPES
jgi:plastocyanin